MPKHSATILDNNDSQNEDSLAFLGMISIDGAGVTVSKKLWTSPMPAATALKAHKELISYIISLSPTGHQDISCRRATIEAGRQDLVAIPSPRRARNAKSKVFSWLKRRADIKLVQDFEERFSSAAMLDFFGNSSDSLAHGIEPHPWQEILTVSAEEEIRCVPGRRR
ncbi:hypothetical protein BX666DRAFT_2118994 [Dichotomocladium elegans]|nr:hypothetical protein BX666DRAFT_2118994 [Dichotomocladium elegans]